MRMPYFHLLLDLGWLFSLRTVLMYQALDNNIFHVIRLEIILFGKSFQIGLYYPQMIGNVKVAYRWRCKFFHKQKITFDAYDFKDWVECSCGKKWLKSEDL